MSKDEHVEPGSDIEEAIERAIASQMRHGDSPTTATAAVGTPETSAVETGDSGDGDGD